MTYTDIIDEQTYKMAFADTYSDVFEWLKEQNIPFQVRIEVRPNGEWRPCFGFHNAADAVRFDQAFGGEI